MMTNPKQIFGQIRRLTTDLINLSLSDQQNFPYLRQCAKGYEEIGIKEKGSLSYALKNVSYQDVYKELIRTGTYNLKMLDGALIHMMYRFRNSKIESHRLAFFPSPFLEEFQNAPDNYLYDEIYADVIKRNIVPFPVRFDFDCRDEIFVEVDHPKSHLTLGQYENCRIPVSAPITPYHFIDFILRNFYHTAFCKFSNRLTTFKHKFDVSITNREKNIVHLQIPM